MLESSTTKLRQATLGGYLDELRTGCLLAPLRFASRLCTGHGVLLRHDESDVCRVLHASPLPWVDSQDKIFFLTRNGGTVILALSNRKLSLFSSMLTLTSVLLETPLLHPSPFGLWEKAGVSHSQEI